MIDAILLATVLCGQVYAEPTYVPSEVVYVYPPTVEYWFGNWSKETEFQAPVLYGKDWKKVPIVNGFAPEIKKSGSKIIYDYRGKILYERCLKPEPKKTYPMPMKAIPHKKLELAPLKPLPPPVPTPSYRDRGLLRPSDVK